MVARKARPVDLRDSLRAGAAALGVDLDARALDRLERYVDELERWNARSNLVGEHDRRALVERHVVDSLAAVPVVRAVGADLRIADVGSGAGLPGVPLAIVLEPREMVLVEPRRKRASFLRAVRRLLPDLPLRVVEGRVEDLAATSEDTASFDAVTSRAALDDSDLCNAAAPLLRDGGLLIAYRGPNVADDQGEPTVAVASFAAPRVEPYNLPGVGRKFALVLRRRLPRFT